MLDKDYLIPSEALQILKSTLPHTEPPKERIPIEIAYSRVLAEDIIAPEDLPYFDRSTVDGFAVIASDTFGASEVSPIFLNLTQEVLMGESVDFALQSGYASKIPTGGMLPQGANAVVMIENTQVVSDDIIEITKSVAPFENVIQKGDDVKANSLVLTKGMRLRPHDIGALAGIGITTVEVYTRPKVSIILTGDEIIEPSAKPQKSQVRDINSYTLAGLVADAFAEPIKMGIVRDDFEEILSKVKHALSLSDIVLITGGTSAGVKDMTESIINGLGKPGVLFHGVRMKPGKPLIAGLIDGKYIFGLPGHPAAVPISFGYFVKPILTALSGQREKFPAVKTLKAKMAKSVASSAGREDHIRVSIDDSGLAHPVLGKSGLISTMSKADGIVVIPADMLGIEQGQEVVVELF